jgi:hypothetical protein
VLEKGLCFARLLDGAGQTSGIKGKQSALWGLFGGLYAKIVPRSARSGHDFR